MSMHRMDITASNGVPFAVVLGTEGESPNPHRSTPGKARVEFFDARHPFDAIHIGERGQFTGGAYYLSTLAAKPRGEGLSLDGGIPAWTVDGASMDAVLVWALSTLASDTAMAAMIDRLPEGGAPVLSGDRFTPGDE